jgi:lipopolysaccharide export system permease protein
MPLLQRYILGELTRTFLVLLTSATLLFVFAGVFSQAKERGLGPWQILQILPYVAPSLLPFTIPSSLLLTVCVVYGRMAGDREIIAAKAAGVNVISIMWPSFFLGAVLSVMALVITDQIIPWSVRNIERTVTLAMEDIFLDLLRARNQVEFREQGISITVMDVKDRTLIMPVFRFSPNGKSQTVIQAQEARLRFDLEKRQVILNLSQGYIDVPGQHRGWFEAEERAFPMPDQNLRAKARDLQVQEIQAAIRDTSEAVQTAERRQAIEAALLLSTGRFDALAASPFRQHPEKIKAEKTHFYSLRTELHNRFAMASNCFFFVLFGSPFSIWMARKQFLTSFMFCFAPILLVYYPLSLMSQNLSRTGMADPTYTVWVGNLVLLLAALFALRKVTQN